MKNGKSKRILCILMSIALIVSVSIIGVYADTTVYTSADGEYMYQLLNDGTASICSGSNAKAYLGSDTTVNIPSSVDGYTVSKLGARAFNTCSSIREINIPSTVTAIDNYTFISCSHLESITLPEGITSIPYGCFLNCSSLASVILPDSLVSIGTAAFKGCASLTRVEIPDGVTSIGNLSFGNCTSLTEIVIPTSVTSINSAAFDGCSSIQTVYGYTGSYAETYANSKGWSFVDLNSLFQNVIYAEDAQANAGEEITVAIKIRNNQGFAGAEIDVNYDSFVLTPIEVIGSSEVLANGSLNDNIGTGTEIPLRVVWSGNSNCSGDGELFSVKFAVNEDAVGTTLVSLAYKQRNTFDENINAVELICQGFEIDISNANADTPKITLDGDNVRAGQQLELKGFLSNLDATKNIRLTVNFDSSAFSFDSVSAQGINIYSISSTSGSVSFTLSGVTTSYNSNELFTIVFNCAKDAAKGSYGFSGSSSTAMIKGTDINIVADGDGDSSVLECADTVARAGETTVTIPVSISNNNGLMGYRLRFTYDASVLSPVGVSNSYGGNLQNNIGLRGNSFDVLWSDSEPFDEDGELLMLEFEIIDNQFSITEIGISYVADDSFNGQYESVDLDCQAASVAVNALIGDVDLNGSIEPNDYTLYREYVAAEEDFSKLQYLMGDIDGDGAVDAFDMFYLDRMINN